MEPEIFSEERLIQARESTLGWCNRIRLERNQQEPLAELPKGKIGDPRSCPCGKATGVNVHTTSYSVDLPDTFHVEHLGQLPPDVRYFVNAFDQGAYPELIEGTLGI